MSKIDNKILISDFFIFTKSNLIKWEWKNWLMRISLSILFIFATFRARNKWHVNVFKYLPMLFDLVSDGLCGQTVEYLNLNKNQIGFFHCVSHILSRKDIGLKLIATQVFRVATIFVYPVH